MILGPGPVRARHAACSSLLPASHGSEICVIIDPDNIQVEISLSIALSFKQYLASSKVRVPCVSSTCSRRSAWAGQKSRRWPWRIEWPRVATPSHCWCSCRALQQSGPPRFPAFTSMCAKRRAVYSLVSSAGAHFFASFAPMWSTATAFTPTFLRDCFGWLAPRFVVLSTVHNVYEGGWHRMLAYRLTDFLSRRTVAVSQAAADRFIRIGAVPRRKCSVILNGIDVQEFAPNGESGARVRAEIGVSDASEEAEFVWLAVGRLAPAKDYPNLLQRLCRSALRARRCAFVDRGRRCSGSDRSIAAIAKRI